MRATRRFQATAGTAIFLASLAVAFERPALFIGAAFVGGWLIATQIAFARSIERTIEDLAIECTSSRHVVATDESTVVTLAARRSDEAALPLTVEAQLPVASSGPAGENRTIELAPDTAHSTVTFEVRWPVAGSFEIGRPIVTAVDRHGLYRERFAHGQPLPIAVEPRTPRNVRIGAGGSEIAVAYGEHDAGRVGAGLDLAELREYQSGDGTHRIDWKATARLSRPHVREFEAESDMVTTLVLDHGGRLEAGPPGETKFACLRHVALAIVSLAQSRNDPIGLCSVGDEGVTAFFAPRSGRSQYAAIRRHVEQLTPTDEPNVATAAPPARSPAAAREAAAALADDSSDFAAVLRPYLDSLDPYVRRIESRPIVGAIRTYLSRVHGTSWTVLLSDDADPVQIREAAKLLAGGDDSASIFLTPSVLFAENGLVDLEAAYDQYVEFEAFRRKLARLERVSAFEVGPRDRVEALLTTGGRVQRPSDR